jgi:hypothetical protein
LRQQILIFIILFLVLMIFIFIYNMVKINCLNENIHTWSYKYLCKTSKEKISMMIRQFLVFSLGFASFSTIIVLDNLKLKIKNNVKIVVFI